MRYFVAWLGMEGGAEGGERERLEGRACPRAPAVDRARHAFAVAPGRSGEPDRQLGPRSGGGLGDLVITLMNLGRANIDATIRAAASRGDVEIVSRPVLLASNNQEARFLVGSQRPFVQVRRSLTTDLPQHD